MWQVEVYFDPYIVNALLNHLSRSSVPNMTSKSQWYAGTSIKAPANEHKHCDGYITEMAYSGEAVDSGKSDLKSFPVIVDHGLFKAGLTAIFQETFRHHL